MRHPNYLVLSRHNIYYFRWPLPPQLRKQGKSAHIKLSLRTREPKEALRITKHLVYHTEQLIQQHGFQLMDYATVKDTIKQHLTQVLEKQKAEMSTQGPYSPKKLSQINNAIARLEQEASGEWEDIYSLVDGYDENKYNQIVNVFSKEDLDKLSDDEKEQALRLLRLGQRDMWQQALEHNNSLDKFSFGTSTHEGVASTNISTEDLRLSFLIKEFVKEKEKENAWGKKHTKDERAGFFKFLLEILGENIHYSSIDIKKARFVKSILIELPSRRAGLKETLLTYTAQSGTFR